MEVPASTPEMIPVEYAHFVDSGDAAALLALFAEQGSLSLPDGSTRTGRSEIAKFYPLRPRDAQRPRPTNHVITNVRVENVGPDAAEVECCFQVLDRQGLVTWGRYRDRLTRSADSWLIEQRRVVVDGRRPV